MEKKLVTLIVRITRLSETMKSMTDDLDKIAQWLQDPEILAVFAESGLGVITSEDYD